MTEHRENLAWRASAQESSVRMSVAHSLSLSLLQNIFQTVRLQHFLWWIWCDFCLNSCSVSICFKHVSTRVWVLFSLMRIVSARGDRNLQGFQVSSVSRYKCGALYLIGLQDCVSWNQIFVLLICFSWRKLLWTVNVTSMETATRKIKARDCLFGIIWPRHTTYTTSSLMAMCCIRKRRWLRGSKNSDNDLTPIVWIFLVCFVNYLLSVSWSGTLAIFVIVVHARTCWRRHMADEIDGCVVMRFNGTCFCICRYIYHRKARAKEPSPTLFSMGYLTRGFFTRASYPPFNIEKCSLHVSTLSLSGKCKRLIKKCEPVPRVLPEFVTK